MIAKDPIKYYLIQSVKMNGRHILIALIGTLAFGLILATTRVFPPIANLFSEHMLGEFVVDLPVKAAFLIIPIVLFYKSKTHKEWQEANQDTSITKKEFATAIYLEIFLSTFIGIFALLIIWIVAGLVDPSIVDRIHRVGVFSLGEGFLWVGLMTTLVFTLQFTALVKIAKGSLLLCASLLGSLQVIVILQNISWYFIDDVGIPIPLVTLTYASVGLFILVIGRTITARLYDKVDL